MIGSVFDVALRVGWMEDSQYKSRKLAELSHVIVASSDYLATKAVPKQIHDLSDWAWIKLAMLPISKQLTNRAGEAPAINPKVTLEVDSVMALCAAARHGMGVSAVPRTLVEKI